MEELLRKLGFLFFILMILCMLVAGYNFYKMGTYTNDNKEVLIKIRNEPDYKIINCSKRYFGPLECNYIDKGHKNYEEYKENEYCYELFLNLTVMFVNLVCAVALLRIF